MMADGKCHQFRNAASLKTTKKQNSCITVQ